MSDAVQHQTAVDGARVGSSDMNIFAWLSDDGERALCLTVAREVDLRFRSTDDRTAADRFLRDLRAGLDEIEAWLKEPHPVSTRALVPPPACAPNSA